MPDSRVSETVQKAISAIDRGDTLQGLLTFECSRELRKLPLVNSYLAYCIARERGQVKEALVLCQAVLRADPRNPAHYLNLGRIYLLTREKTKAIEAFQKGLQIKPYTLISVELKKLGIRKRVPFSSLKRAHPLNKIVGKMLRSFHAR